MNCYPKVKINATITESYFSSGTSTAGTLGNFSYCLPEGKIKISEFNGNFRPFKNKAKI